jgi:hypothetical protein
MFGQTFKYLPRLFSRTFRRIRANLYQRLRELSLRARVRKGWNLPQVFAQIFREGCANPRPRVMQTFRLVLSKPPPKASQAHVFKMILALPSDLVKTTSVRASGAPKFCEYELGV